MGAKVPASSLKEEVVREYRETERQKMHNILDKYLQICLQMGVSIPSSASYSTFLPATSFASCARLLCKEIVFLNRNLESYLWYDVVILPSFSFAQHLKGVADFLRAQTTHIGPHVQTKLT